MDGHTSSNNASRPNPRAWWAVVFGLLSLAAMPAGVILARESDRVTLRAATGSIAVALVFGWLAIQQARRAREHVQLTLERAGGLRAARVGRLLGILGVLLAITAGLAVGFWGLLTLFAG